MKRTLLLGILFTGLSALSQNGELDDSFGTGGKIITSINAGADKAYSVALQADGKIVVAGMTTSTVTGMDFACLRYNNDGTLDTSFGTNGIYTVDVQTGSDDVAYSVAIQADEKIILAGFSDDGSNKNAAVIRLNANGTIDTTFGAAGKVLTDFILNRADEIKVVKIHALTGNIIVGGTSSLTSTNSQAVIARYTSVGSLDTTFNTTGILSNLPDAGSGTYYHIIEDLAVKTNGKISAVGWINQQGLSWSADHYVCRINSNGTLDTAFSSDGAVISNGGFNGDDKTFSMILNSDDSVLFSGGGYLSTLQYDYFLGLYNSTGSSVAGKALFDYGSLVRDISYGMGIDSQGKTILAGSSVTSSTNSTFGIGRVNADYSIDSSFGSAGKVITTFGTNTTNEAFDMVIQPDDKIIAVGYSGNDFAIARYVGNFLSVNDFGNPASVILYPTPTRETLFINVANLSLEGQKYEIIDLNGRVILEGKLETEMNQLNINLLSSGIYTFKITNTNIIKKFVKQ